MVWVIDSNNFFGEQGAFSTNIMLVFLHHSSISMIFWTSWSPPKNDKLKQVIQSSFWMRQATQQTSQVAFSALTSTMWNLKLQGSLDRWRDRIDRESLRSGLPGWGGGAVLFFFLRVIEMGKQTFTRTPKMNGCLKKGTILYRKLHLPTNFLTARC